jgi:NAD(P)-dependent dehydrogenase (short-subunit alcohol dehydrogenase family)
MSDKIWFITGASRGFGRIWAEGALARGDKVVATARSVSPLSGLAETYGDAVLPLALDVTKREQVEAVIPKAHSHFGRLDVVINNAGYPFWARLKRRPRRMSARNSTRTSLARSR